ncbi:hypothetical protein [Streptomyces antibioticus]|uniref:hypothetical protein n=1 Tax=Streptomyces antibioticus TaxID=1890 RepID=UPI0037AE985D
MSHQPLTRPLTRPATDDSRLLLWLRVREFAVPASMIETATARRLTGDWAGACAAAAVDVDLPLRSVARRHGRERAERIRSDLRHLAPDLLRWHLPRIAPDGLLRPGLTIPLARYDPPDGDGGPPLRLVVRTPPGGADAAQRVSLALWEGPGPGSQKPGFEGTGSESTGFGGTGFGGTGFGGTGGRHPHPLPSRRFRLDLHRHLWDARRTDELRLRSGADRPPDTEAPASAPRYPVDRWAAEARLLLRADRAGETPGRPHPRTVVVRLGGRHRLALDVEARPVIGPVPADAAASGLPLLPDASTWVPPDLELLRAGLIDADRLHPLVAAALAPGHSPPSPGAGPAPPPGRPGQPRIVECRGARHRIGLVDGMLAALDHDPAEIRREELLAALTGTPLPCLRFIDEAHRRPDCLPDVRERLRHGDVAGALAVVEGLLGPDAVLRGGPLREALEAAARGRIAYGLFRAGLTEQKPALPLIRTSGRGRARRSRPRHATFS